MFLCNNLYHNYDYLEKVINETLKEEGVSNAVFSIIFVRLSESIMVRAFPFCLISTALQRHMAFTGFSSHREQKSARAV